MTETKHSQESGIRLPEKEWFRLDEVAGRWSELTGQTVTVDDLLHYEDTGKLTIAGVFVTVVDLGESETLPMTTLNDLTSVASQLRAYGFVKHFIDGDHIDEAVINKHAGSLVSVMKYDGHRMSLPEHEIHIPINMLCVPLEECDRFEQEYIKGKPAPATTTKPDTAEPQDRPWAHLIDSQNPKTGSLYKQDAARIRESLTPEEKRMWAREAVARNDGNKTKAGREMGVSESCIRDYLKT